MKTVWTTFLAYIDVAAPTRSTGTMILGLLLALVVQVRPGSATEVCAAITDALKVELSDYVDLKYKIPHGVRLRVIDTEPVGTTCYRKVTFASDDFEHPRRVILFLSPDQRFLTRDLFDRRLDPQQEERAQHEQLRIGLTQGTFAFRGPRDAPVTITIFSDFQCPYCKMVADVLAADVLPHEGQNVRIVFRHLPLPMHDWALSAAEASVCAQMQSDEAFWAAHDYLFSRQREISRTTLTDLLIEQLRTVPSFDTDRFTACVKQHTSAERVQRDIAFGATNGIQATPTLFINSVRLNGTAGSEQIRTIVHQLLRGERGEAIQ